MKPIKLHLKRLPTLLSILLLTFCLTMISCKNGDSKKEQKIDSTGISTTDTIPAEPQFYNEALDAQEDTVTSKAIRAIELGEPGTLGNETYVMSITGDQLRSLFNGGGAMGTIVALRLKFHTEDGRFSLKASGMNINRVINEPTRLTRRPNTPPTPNPNNLIRRYQLITLGQMKKLLGLTQQGPIPLEELKTMYFKASTIEHPRYPGQKLMFLYYSLDADFNKMDITEITNPSPPFLAPCGNSDCEAPDPLAPKKTKN